MAQEASYVLGHSQTELDRLARQAKLIDPITKRGFLSAGLGSGMRVLDVGSGVGDVAFLAASIVGPEGEVVGTDRAAAPLEIAWARAGRLELQNVSFLQGDPAAIEFDGPFDAVIGRYILMFQPDPVAFLRSVARHAKPGGIIAFHEPDWEGARSFPECEIFDSCCRAIAKVCIRSGAKDRMGAELTQCFIEAGLPGPHMEVGELIGGAEAAVEPASLVSELTISLLPELERYSVIEPGLIQSEGLYERMIGEAIEKRATLVGRSEIVAFARKLA